MALTLWSDTYADLASIDMHLSGNPTWASFTPTQQESAIKRATAQIDAVIQAEGSPESEIQNLQFPRVFSHEKSVIYPDLYVKSTQQRRLVQCIATQIEHTFSRSDIGLSDYSLGGETIRNSDPHAVSWKALMGIGIYLVKQNAELCI